MFNTPPLSSTSPSYPSNSDSLVITTLVLFYDCATLSDPALCRKETSGIYPFEVELICDLLSNAFAPDSRPACNVAGPTTQKMGDHPSKYSDEKAVAAAWLWAGSADRSSTNGSVRELPNVPASWIIWRGPKPGAVE